MPFFRSKAAGAPDFLIVGLGNPGKEYADTRHNAGCLALEELARKVNAAPNRLRFKGQCGEATIGERRVLLLFPLTFMNHSGEAVSEAMRFYKLTPDRLLVLSDDISLPVGGLRIRKKGSDGGHNGMKSIIYHLQSDAFPRLRLGVGKKPPEYDLADWVLAKFTDEQIKTMAQAVDLVPDIVTEIVQNGTAGAMNRFNGIK